MKIFAAALCSCALLFMAQATEGDNAADRLLADSQAATKSLRALTAKIEISSQTPKGGLRKNLGSVRLMKPNYALITLTGDYPLVTLASDGKSLYELPDATKYTITSVDPGGKDISTPWWALPVRFFFTQNIKPFGPDSPPWTSSSYKGEETSGSQRFKILEIAGDKPMAYVARLYFDANKLLRRSVVTFGEGANAAVFTAEITPVQTGRPLRAAAFRFTPPRTAKLDTGAEAKMLAAGETAPDFTLPMPDGDPLTLANIRRGQKATIVTFWYVACPPCREEFQLFQKLYADLKQESFAIVAINKIDEAKDIKQYARSAGITFPLVLDERDSPGVTGRYHVETYPSTYLLDAEGKIADRFVGVNEAGLRKTLVRLGLKIQ